MCKLEFTIYGSKPFDSTLYTIDHDVIESRSFKDLYNYQNNMPYALFDTPFGDGYFKIFCTSRLFTDVATYKTRWTYRPNHPETITIEQTINERVA